MRSFWTLLAAPCALFLIVGSLPISARAVEYGGIGGRPAFPRADNDRTSSIFVHTLEPGRFQEEGITVINNTPEEKTLLVYAVDSVPSTDGAFACAQLSDKPKDVGSWIKMSKTEVTLASIANETVPFVITVPENAGVGSHDGCIVVQEKQVAGPEGAGIHIAMRTALRVAITVPGDIIRSLEISDYTAKRNADHSIHYSVSAKNTGNVSLDANVKVVTKDMFGREVADHGGQYPVLRGETPEWNFTFPRSTFGGWYTSELTVAYDASASATTGVQDEGSLTVLTRSGPRIFVPPTPRGAGILLAIFVTFFALIGIALILRLRRHWIHDNWKSYRVKAGDDLGSLAKSRGVSWKLIVKVNKLTPPYALKAGTSIILPPAPGKGK